MKDPNLEHSGNVIARLGRACHRFSLKYMPHAVVLAALLTAIAFCLGIFLAKQTPLQMLDHWGRGFWELLAFAMQMALIIVTGSAIAHSPLMRGCIRGLAAFPVTGRQAVWMISMISILLSFLHWGLSLIVGALLAKEMARQLRRQGIPFEYSLIAAGGYLGLMTWHGMLSASIGLSISTPGHPLEAEIGIIPLSHYMSNSMNVFVSVGLLILPTLAATMMHPGERELDGLRELNPLPPDTLRVLDADDAPFILRPENPSIGDRLTYSPVIAWIIGLLGLTYIYHAFDMKGFSALDLNMINFIFLFLGILLHHNLANYIQAVKAAISGASGVIIQFPFYAGILGMFKYSGLVNILAAGVVSVSNENTFYLWTFLASSLVNLFVPSGGGQWTLEGPAIIAAAKELNADILKTSLMVAYGDTWTNMIHPFWALALLEITGLKAKDIMGYTTAIMLCCGVIFLIAAFLPM